MSRSLIDANATVFTQLDNYCAAQGLVLSNAGSPRWIASEGKHRNFMMNARPRECVHFGFSRKLARFDLNDRSYFFSIGFEQYQDKLRDSELDVDPAFLTVVLSVLQPKPSASINEIRQLIEFSDKNSDPNYRGHAFEDIASLFPKIRAYDISTIGSASIWNVFFRACVEECVPGSFWIEGRLIETLRSMCELDQERIPYRVLCRSIFDGDKSSFFLALYRCLEALYAYSSAHALASALDIATPWGEIASVLEKNLGWHPREEGSLIRILKFASHQDLTSVLVGLRNTDLPENNELLVSRAARAVYDLRNSIVHYRPAQHQIDIDSFDWPIVCESMVGIILDVYEAVFSGSSA